VKQFQIAPSEFWAMPPRHFWWLVETLQPKKTGGGKGLSEETKRDILGWLKGNENGAF
jgi:hypothetical protein